MTLKSKKNITSMAMGILSLVAYLIYALGNSAPPAGDLKAWASAILIFVGISVAAQIVAQIVFHIAVAVGIAVREREKDGKIVERIIKSEMSEDERDKGIIQKASHFGYICVGTGFAAALTALALGALAVTALHILLAACFAAGLAEGIVNICLYEKGGKK